MKALTEHNSKTERVFLVGAELKKRGAIEVRESMEELAELTITAGAWPLPLTITIAVIFTAWPVAFLPFTVTFAAWFITLNFALWAILVSFVLVVRIRPLVGK